MNRSNGVGTFLIVAAVILGLSWVQVEPSPDPAFQAAAQGVDQLELLPGEEGAGQEGAAGRETDGGIVSGRGERRTVGGGASAGGAVVGGGGSASGPGQPGAGPTAADQKACAAGQNGGATDTGVTQDTIKLATTAVLDGPAKSLLEHSVTAMKAVIDRVNREGGVCGRRLELQVRNDSFDGRTGQQYIKNFIAEDVFALPVVPSAEGLGNAIESGDITAARIPVVGTDGMRTEQYGNPYVWPVATATVSTMRIMADYGREVKKAKTFAIVYDSKYKFGVEGKDAFVEHVKRIGGSVVTEQPLDPLQASYGSEAANFNEKCGNDQCDMVALLLLPETAGKWMAREPALGRLYTAGAQTLFTDEFGKGCVQAAGTDCIGIAVWTGYNPPLGKYAGLPDIERYTNDVEAVNPSVDTRNQFVQGAYVGMTVFVEALKRTGPNLTREGLKQAMDSMDFESDFASRLSWRPGKHAANQSARAFSIVAGQGAFTGWRDDNTGFRSDPAGGAT